jgi:hypothetical protein
VEEVEKWIAEAHEKLHLKNNLKDFAVLKMLPETAKVRRVISNFFISFQLFPPGTVSPLLPIFLWYYYWSKTWCVC